MGTCVTWTGRHLSAKTGPCGGGAQAAHKWRTAEMMGGAQVAHKRRTVEMLAISLFSLGEVAHKRRTSDTQATHKRRTVEIFVILFVLSEVK